MVLIAADGGNRLHSPANTRVSVVSAWVAGADAVLIDVRATKDGELVPARDDVAHLTYDELRKLDLGADFNVRGGTGRPWRRDERPEARAQPLVALLDELPAEANVILRVHFGDGDVDPVVKKLVGIVERRGMSARCVVATESFDAITAITTLRRVYVAAPDDRADRCIHSGAQGALVSAAQVFDGHEATDFHATLAAESASGEMPLGMFVHVDGLDAAAVQNVAALDGVECVVGGSAVELAAALRPRRALEEASFAGETEDAGRFRFGYAKANPYGHVHQRDGVHVDLRPYDGATEFGTESDPVERQLSLWKEQMMYAVRDWPFYSGGGVGTAFPLDGDFVAEVDFASTWASQATMLELAVVNVDPPKHRPGWKTLADGRKVPNVPESSRDVGSFFDPHGAPPFVGVEHDEDDGFRINHNLGTQYDNNQYGRPLGDGKSLTGRFRLERRGPWFASYYRDAANPDWVCVGTCRNDSMNRRVYLRCVGKRWRQERAEAPGFSPIPENHITFQNLTIHVALTAR
jgi:hypothetical protein